MCVHLRKEGKRRGVVAVNVASGAGLASAKLCLVEQRRVNNGLEVSRREHVRTDERVSRYN